MIIFNFLTSRLLKWTLIEEINLILFYIFLSFHCFFFSSPLSSKIIRSTSTSNVSSLTKTTASTQSQSSAQSKINSSSMITTSATSSKLSTKKSIFYYPRLKSFMVVNALNPISDQIMQSKQHSSTTHSPKSHATSISETFISQKSVFPSSSSVQGCKSSFSPPKEKQLLMNSSVKNTADYDFVNESHSVAVNFILSKTYILSLKIPNSVLSFSSIMLLLVNQQLKRFARH